MQQDSPASTLKVPADAKQIRHLRQILLWPVQLLALQEGAPVQHHWEHLAKPDPDNPWRELDDEFGDPAEFQERHYNEFVTFLPPVQRFLYGQGLCRAVKRSYGESPIRAIRRTDIAKVRLTLSEGRRAYRAAIVHVDLYFFFDIDIVILALEVAADNLPLGVRAGGAVPLRPRLSRLLGGGQRGGHCPWLVEWLCPKGEVLARSDYEKREKYLAFVCQHRAPAVAAHWEFLLSRWCCITATGAGPRALPPARVLPHALHGVLRHGRRARADAAGPRSAWHRQRGGRLLGAALLGKLPGRVRARFCYDRYCDARLGDAGRRHALHEHRAHARRHRRGRRPLLRRTPTAGSSAASATSTSCCSSSPISSGPPCTCSPTGSVAAVSRLDIGDADATRVFRRDIRHALENFLRFEHRYWFYEISNQAQARELYAMTRQHLEPGRALRDIREELQDMGNFLDVDAMRRQNETRGAPHRGHHLRPDRHGVHGLPRHEPAGMGRAPD